MKRKAKNKTGRITAFFLALLLMLQTTYPVYAQKNTEDENAASEQNEEQDEEQEETQTPVETIYIDDAEDFLALAENCTMDTWSVGKYVVLQDDISLEGTDFLPIPTFGGIFDGGGHTINGFTISDSVAPAGLFGVLQESAVVQNLNVNGSIDPAGKAEAVGGIAGENNGTIVNCTFTGSVSGKRYTGGIVGINAALGVLQNCSVSGSVFGDAMTGGIAGYNLGAIAFCRNDAYINISSVDPSINLEDINLDFSTDITKLYSMDTNLAATDTGGIAGYSSGVLQGCVNNSTVGYQHIGYNVGGIAGRSCGYINECTNNADIYGRKDVGGIVGQMEPYIIMDMSENTIAKLEEQIDDLNSMVNSASSHANAATGRVNSGLNNMANYANTASEAVQSIKNTDASVINSVVGNMGNPLDNVTITPSDIQIDIGNIEEGQGSIEVKPGDIQIDQNAVTGNVTSALDQIELNTSMHQLPAAVSGMTEEMKSLNNQVSGTAGTLASDIRKINNQVNAISNTLSEAKAEAENIAENGLVSDTSEEDVDAVTYGKAYSGKNLGYVNGDINVGGIAGTISIEYEADPENDISMDLSEEERQEYEMKAILQNCVNTGEITAKRNYAGGICGRMDLGLITECEGYGDIKSESGDYVGGIAGVTSGSVRNCFVKCTLEGANYIGGIVGSGVEEDVTGGASSVTGCYAMVDVAEYEQFVGSISGADAGEFLENYYVADHLPAINRMSYAGKAEPITYEELLSVPDLPEEFRQLALKFVVEDETVLTIPFDYGASFDESIYPEIPQKDGYYAKWDTYDLDGLHFDTIVTAEYLQYTTALEGSKQREDGKAIFLVEGDFTEDDAVTMTEQTQTPSEFDVASEGIGTTLKSCFASDEDEGWPVKSINREVLEQWKLEIPDDGTRAHTVRYLAPDKETKDIKIYVKQEEEWNKVDYETIGSYLAFSVEGETAEVAVVSTMSIWWIWLITLLVLLGLLFLLVRFVMKYRKLRNLFVRAAEKEELQERPENALETSETSEDEKSQETSETDAQEELMQRVLRAEEELKQARAHIQALETGKVLPTEQETESDSPENASGKTKKKRLIVALIIGLLALLAAGAVLYIRSDFRKGMEAYQLLREYAERTDRSMELTVSADVGSEKIDTTAEIIQTECEGQRVTCIEQSGIKLYYTDEKVYLKNGRAFLINGIFPDYSNLMNRAADLYQAIDITEEKNGENKTYSIITEGKNAKLLLELLLPSVSDELSDAQTLRVDLDVTGKEPTALRFSGNGTLDNDTKTAVAVAAELIFQGEESQTTEIPAEVRASIADKDAAVSGELGEDLFRLLAAWSDIIKQEDISAQLSLSADCGPLKLDDSMKVFQITREGEKIRGIRQKGITVYFNDDKICDEKGNAVTGASKDLAASANIWEIAYEACVNGEPNCAQKEGKYIYTLTLDEEAMKAVAYAIAPETKNMDILFDMGSIKLTVVDDKLSELQVSCSGSLDVAISNLPVTLTGRLQVDDTSTAQDYTIPDAVLEALTGEED